MDHPKNEILILFTHFYAVPIYFFCGAQKEKVLYNYFSYDTSS